MKPNVTLRERIAELTYAELRLLHIDGKRLDETGWLGEQAPLRRAAELMLREGFFRPAPAVGGAMRVVVGLAREEIAERSMRPGFDEARARRDDADARRFRALCEQVVRQNQLELTEGELGELPDEVLLIIPRDLARRLLEAVRS